MEASLTGSVPSARTAPTLGAGRSVAGNATRALAVLAVISLALASVGSVLALGTDTAAFSGAVESNTWLGGTNPGGGGGTANGDLDLRVKAGACDPADDLTTYSDDPTFSLVGVSLDLAAVAAADGGMTGEKLGTWCLHNASASDGTLYGQILSSSSVEVGTCDAQEATVDTTCSDGEPGELADQLDLRVSTCHTLAFESADQDGDNVFDYFVDTYVWMDNIGAPYWGGVNDPFSTALIDSLPAGGTCQIEIGVTTQHYGSGDPDMLVGLSDSTSFDLAIDLREF